MFPITALYAAPLALLFLWLSARVITYRRSAQIGLGDQGDKGLLKRIRAQANCAEYVPIGILLLAFVEASAAPALLTHALGLMLLVGRLLHGWGFSASPPVMQGRVLGMLLTLTMIGLSALCLLALQIF